MKPFGGSAYLGLSDDSNSGMLFGLSDISLKIFQVDSKMLGTIKAVLGVGF
ncbi:MAG: hypothetical protein P8176_04620 [Gammaproteobacteria bacterium]